MPIHRGVYLTHTGEPSWLQRAWAAVLSASSFRDGRPEGAALSHESALRVCDGPGRRDANDDQLHVAIEEDRHVAAPDGVVLHRTHDLAGRALMALAPPRLRYEDALVDVAAHAGDRLAVVGMLTDAVGARRTTATRLIECVGRRARLADRTWIVSVLADAAAGTCSVLEHAYLRDVERAHGLPTALRQQRVVTEGGVIYRDATYDGVVVELDGRAFHEGSAQREADLERDLAAAAAGEVTIRLGWGQVFRRPCQTARSLALVLRSAGVPVTPRACGPGCLVEAAGLPPTG